MIPVSDWLTALIFRHVEEDLTGAAFGANSEFGERIQNRQRLVRLLEIVADRLGFIAQIFDIRDRSRRLNFLLQPVKLDERIASEAAHRDNFIQVVSPPSYPESVRADRIGSKSNYSTNVLM